MRALVLALLTVFVASGGSAAAETPRKLRQAPGFTLYDWQGRRVALEQFRGQAVLLQFFRTGCVVCQREAPLLERLSREYKAKGLVVIGISHEQGAAEALKKYSEEYRITFPLLVGDLEVGVRYLGVTPQRPSFQTPRLFLIDREGSIVREYAPERHPEFFENEEAALEQAVKEILAAPPPDLRPTGSLNR